MIYSLYIFDRHCDCVYYQDWHRSSPVRPPPAINFKPGVHRLPLPPDPLAPARESIFSQSHNRNSTQSLESQFQTRQADSRVNGTGPRTAGAGRNTGLPFDEEAKLVYGVVLSLRNMVKKLSGKDDAFTSYRTQSYKFHYFETPTNYRFILLSDPSADSLRFVLRQLYTGPFLDFVVRNPLVELDSRETGVDNDQVRLHSSSLLAASKGEYRTSGLPLVFRVEAYVSQFRAAVDRHIRGLTMFGT